MRNKDLANFYNFIIKRQILLWIKQVQCVTLLTTPTE